MSKNDLRNISTIKEYDKFLTLQGYKSRHGGGSHIIYNCTGKPSLSIPCHNRMSEKLSPGTKRNIDKLILGESYYK